MGRVFAVVRGLLVIAGTAVVFIVVIACLMAVLGHGMDVRSDSVLGDFWDGRGIGSDGENSPSAVRLTIVTAGLAGLVAVTAIRGRRRRH